MAKAPRKTIAKKAAAPAKVAAVAPAELKSFYQRSPDHDGVSFTRYWWDGPGPREGIAPFVRKKLRPGDDPVFGHAARSEVLLPASAPSDYADIDFLLERFDATLPPHAWHAMVQVKVELDPAQTWHAAYEDVRAFARGHFAVRFPVVLVAHVPGTAGLTGFGNHIHCIALSRPLDLNGLGGACNRLCSDRGREDAFAAWDAHLTQETA